MDFNEYQAETRRTRGNQDHDSGAFVCAALGAVGESAEISEHAKKVIFHGHAFDPDKVIEEVGDTLWYLAWLAELAGVTLAEVAERNLAKLRARYPDRFDPERSIHRAENSS